jgi:hypothetical protein
MKTARRLKVLIVFYLGVLISLMLSVIAMPIFIQQGLPMTGTFVIEEEILEASLIAILIGVSYFILRGFMRELRAYAYELDRTTKEKSRLMSRLSESFGYIGIINVELQAIQSIFCGVDRYPQTKKEFQRFINDLVARAMTVAGTPWVVIRMISRCSGRTIAEYSSVRPKKVLPSATIGNREILEDRHVGGLRKIDSSPKNLDLMTVCILPTTQLSEEENILITAITNQIEIFFMLYRAGFIDQQAFNDHTDLSTNLFSEPT